MMLTLMPASRSSNLYCHQNERLDENYRSKQVEGRKQAL